MPHRSTLARTHRSVVPSIPNKLIEIDICIAPQERGRVDYDAPRTGASGTYGLLSNAQALITP